MKALVGVDGSDGAMAAVRMAARVLSPERDSIDLYCSPPHPIFNTEDALQREKTRIAAAHHVFEQAQNLLPEEMRGRTRWLIGDEGPRHELATADQRWGAEMIVVGARGAGAVARFLVGSVVTALAHHAAVPVLVVRASTTAATQPLRILLAYDGSPAAKAAGDLVGRLALPQNTTVQVTSAIEPFVSGAIEHWLRDQPPTPEIEEFTRRWQAQLDEQRRQREDAARDFCRQLPERLAAGEPIIREGHAAEAILQTIEKEHSDLVVVGSRGLGAVSRLMLGSTSERVLLHAPCSVLLVHAGNKE